SLLTALPPACRLPVHWCSFSLYWHRARRVLHPFPTRRSSDLFQASTPTGGVPSPDDPAAVSNGYLSLDLKLAGEAPQSFDFGDRSEEHTSELQSRENLVCRLLLEKKKD